MLGGAALAQTSAAHTGKLEARCEPSGFAITRDGLTVHAADADAASAVLYRVPLRADGSDPALWALVQKPSPRVSLIRPSAPPAVIFGTTLYDNTPHVSSTRRAHWLVDLDGDGFNDLIEVSSTHSDVGTQNDVVVRRFDAATHTFVIDRALGKKAPRSLPMFARLDRLVAQSIKATGRVELRHLIDGWTEVLGGAALDSGSLTAGSPPWVGSDVLGLALVWKGGTTPLADAHLVHLRMIPKPTVVSTFPLGVMAFPNRACGGQAAGLRREGGGLVAVWSRPSGQVVEQRFGWDGEAVRPSAEPPKVLASCPGPMP